MRRSKMRNKRAFQNEYYHAFQNDTLPKNLAFQYDKHLAPVHLSTLLWHSSLKMQCEQLAFQDQPFQDQQK